MLKRRRCCCRKSRKTSRMKGHPRGRLTCLERCSTGTSGVGGKSRMQACLAQASV